MYIVKWTEEKKECAISMLTEYFAKFGPGDVIYQSDLAMIEAPELLANIACYVLSEGEGLIYNINLD